MGPRAGWGVVKAGWWAHCCNPKEQGLQWPYLPHASPLAGYLYLEEVDIQHHAWDTEQKSYNRSCQSSYRVFAMPPLWLLPMPWKMI